MKKTDTRGQMTGEAGSRAAQGLVPQTHMQRLADRFAAGKALRQKCSRKSQAVWDPPADRADPIDLLIENSRGRMEDLVPIRYGRMAANPFAFYRGAAWKIARRNSRNRFSSAFLSIVMWRELVS